MLCIAGVNVSFVFRKSQNFLESNTSGFLQLFNHLTSSVCQIYCTCTTHNIIVTSAPYCKMGKYVKQFLSVVIWNSYKHVCLLTWWGLLLILVLLNDLDIVDCAFSSFISPSYSYRTFKCSVAHLVELIDGCRLCCHSISTSTYKAVILNDDTAVTLTCF